MVGSKSTVSSAPPSGRTLERRAQTQRNRFANPLAADVRVSDKISSSFVMCPMIEMCAPVAHAGWFLVRLCKEPVSHASLMTAESVLASAPPPGEHARIRVPRRGAVCHELPDQLPHPRGRRCAPVDVWVFSPDRVPHRPNQAFTTGEASHYRSHRSHESAGNRNLEVLGARVPQPATGAFRFSIGAVRPSRNRRDIRRDRSGLRLRPGKACWNHPIRVAVSQETDTASLPKLQ